MSEAIELDAANENENNQVKIRSCLMCKDDFESAWSGERVCKRCKSQSKWIIVNSNLAA